MAATPTSENVDAGRGGAERGVVLRRATRKANTSKYMKPNAAYASARCSHPSMRRSATTPPNPAAKPAVPARGSASRRAAMVAAATPITASMA